MSNEKNPYNFYDHIETIEQSLNWLKTIHVHSLSDKEFTAKEHYELKEKVADLEKQVEEYELDLNGLRLEIEHYKSLQCSLESRLEIKQKEVDFLNATDEYLINTQNRYNKIPWIFRKLFGAE